MSDEPAVEDDDIESVDYVVAVWREEGRWTASALPAEAATSLDDLAAALRRFPGEGGVLGFVQIADEFFIGVRQTGERTRAFVSDGTAVLDWGLADEALEAVGLQVDDDDLEELEPVGDLALYADFGLDATELAFICTDPDLYPDEQVRAIAKRIGFDTQITSLVRAG